MKPTLVIEILCYQTLKSTNLSIYILRAQSTRNCLGEGNQGLDVKISVVPVAAAKQHMNRVSKKCFM